MPSRTKEPGQPASSGRPKVNDEEFLELYKQFGLRGTAAKLKMDHSNVAKRRRSLERKYQRGINSPSTRRPTANHPQRQHIEIDTGVAIVGSDAHYWPGAASTAHRAFVKFCQELKPKLIVVNGDAFDGATISRHPPINWESRPTVINELEAVQERLSEIEDAAPAKAKLTWNLGNHDSRFETRLAHTAPEFARVAGFHLKDHFSSRWSPAWSTWVNDNVVIKHRFKGGMHAPHNNTLWSGKTVVTGHLHSAKVMPITDYNGTRWGVDTGCLADPWGPQFVHYTEDNPKNWISGFGVFTFYRGLLLPPELVTVWDGDSVSFRGQIIKV